MLSFFLRSSKKNLLNDNQPSSIYLLKLTIANKRQGKGVYILSDNLRFERIWSDL